MKLVAKSPQINSKAGGSYLPAARERRRDGETTGSLRRRRVLRYPWRLAATVFLFGYLLFLFGRGYFRLWHLEAQSQEIRARILRTQEKNETLREKIKFMRSDAYVEQTAREELGLIYPGETLFVVAKVVGENGGAYFDVQRRPGVKQDTYIGINKTP